MSETPSNTTVVCSNCHQPISQGQPTEYAGAIYCANCVGKALDGEAARQKGTQRDYRVAVLLSLLPGLGQMYNGQMTKGLLVLGGFMFAATVPIGQLKAAAVCTIYFWNLFDSYWTALRLNQAEIPVIPPLPEEQRWESAATPAWGVLLIVTGAIFLLNNLGVTWLTFDRIWPALLLCLGVWLLIVFALSRRSTDSVHHVSEFTIRNESEREKSQEADHDQTAQNLSR